LLRKNGFSVEQVRALLSDYGNAGLTPAEMAMFEYAEKIAQHGDEVTEQDVAGLREHGFSDGEILDIAFAAAARCFFSKTLQAIGAEPDEAYADLARELDDLLPQ
jgi:alkylhydroperoxidase family enzyme